MRNPIRLSLSALAAALMAACNGGASTVETVTSDLNLSLTTIVDGAEQPWGMAFLPDGTLLFTEKEDGLKHVMPGSSHPD